MARSEGVSSIASGLRYAGKRSKVVLSDYEFPTVGQIFHAQESLWRFAPLDLLWQTLWQGVLIGCISLIALNRAIEHLGAERSSALVAFVPALSALLGFFFLGEVPSVMETAALLAISAGVTIAAAPQPRAWATAAVLLRGAPR